jgi:sugar phosphate isomerase/epimerase
MTIHLSITAAEEAPDSAPFILRGPFSKSIGTAGILGYDAIELHVANPSRLDADAIGQELEATGIRISTLGTGLCYAQEGLSLTSPDKQARQKAVERIKAHICFARNFGSSVIIGLIRGKISECESENTYFSRLRDSLADCLEAAETSDVPLVLESVNSHEADALTSAEETLAFMDRMGFRRLLLLLDTYHMDLTGEPWAATFALAGKRLGHVHLADRNRLSPGSAGIDFAEVIRNLYAIGYQGSLAMECKPLPTPLQAAKDALAHMNAVLHRNGVR